MSKIIHKSTNPPFLEQKSSNSLKVGTAYLANPPGKMAKIPEFLTNVPILISYTFTYSKMLENFTYCGRSKSTNPPLRLVILRKIHKSTPQLKFLLLKNQRNLSSSLLKLPIANKKYQIWYSEQDTKYCGS